MDVQPVDQGAILRSGQAAVPNYAQQVMQDAMLRLQQQQADTQATNVNSQAQARQRDADRQDSFGRAVQALGSNPNAQQLATLAIQFPEFSEAVKRSYDTMDASRQRTDFQQMANIMAAARGGNFELAARLMRQRVQADTAAGDNDPIDAAILTALESPDPRQHTAATALLETSVSAINPSQFAATYGSLSHNVKVDNGIAYDGNTGQPLWQVPLVIPGSNGSFNTPETLPNIPIVGQGGVAQGAPETLPQPQAPREAPAFAGGQPMTVDDVSRGYPADNPNTAAREQPRAVDPRANLPYGDPLHPGPGPNSQVYRVRSRQEYDRVPSGAEYIDPHGNRRVKP